MNDCFDISDENAFKNSSPMLNTIILRCILTSKCKVFNSDILVYIHAICDGRNIYVLSHMNTLCGQNKKVSINTHDMQNNFYFGSERIFKQTTTMIMHLYFQKQKCPKM